MIRFLSSLLLSLLLSLPLSAYCIHAGGPDTFLADGISIDCFADTFFSGGTPYTDLDGNTSRYGANGVTFSYTIPAAPVGGTVPSGFYRVTLKFIDPNVTAVGGRIFRININGQDTPNIDLAAESGGASRVPVTKTYLVNSFGQIKLSFVTIVRTAIVSEIRVDPIRPLDIFNAAFSPEIKVFLAQAYRDAILTNPCVTGKPGPPPNDYVCPPGFNGLMIEEWKRLASSMGPICLRMGISEDFYPVILIGSNPDCLTDPLTWWYRKDGAGNVL